MWYFMSPISMVLLLSPSCSDLLVISVLNLEPGRRDKEGLERAFYSITAWQRPHPSPDRSPGDRSILKITAVLAKEFWASNVLHCPGLTDGWAEPQPVPGHSCFPIIKSNGLTRTMTKLLLENSGSPRDCPSAPCGVGGGSPAL